MAVGGPAACSVAADASFVRAVQRQAAGLAQRGRRQRQSTQQPHLQQHAGSIDVLPRQPTPAPVPALKASSAEEVARAAPAGKQGKGRWVRENVGRSDRTDCGLPLSSPVPCLRLLRRHYSHAAASGRGVHCEWQAELIYLCKRATRPSGWEREVNARCTAGNRWAPALHQLAERSACTNLLWGL